MANPFGVVVDNYKLKQMERYVDKIITQEDRAREAMHLINEDGKNQKAAKYVENLKGEYGDGVSTLCVFYNATGDTLYCVDYHNWLGNVGRTPYPSEIGNGQWASFLHVHPTSQSTGCEAAVVYRGKNKDGQDYDYLVAWSTPWGPWYKNKSWCDVEEVDKFRSGWDQVKSMLEGSDRSHDIEKQGCIIETDIATGTSPQLRATFKTPYSN